MFDYVIVGGGSAGCVLAARLTEAADAWVLLIEAGPRDTDPYIHMPVGFFKMTSGPLTWGYETAPMRHANNRVAVYPQARVIGGGSSINAEVYTRGCPEDYDGWGKGTAATAGAGASSSRTSSSEDNNRLGGDGARRRRPDRRFRPGPPQPLATPTCRAAWTSACPTIRISIPAGRTAQPSIRRPPSMAAAAAPWWAICSRRWGGRT